MISTKKTLFSPILAALMLAGCSNDNTENLPETFTDDEAYISVRLSDAGSLYSRATSGDNGYEYGSADEQKVKNAYFYFYDEDGVFVSQGSAWNDGNSNTNKPDGNIEFTSNTVVVLKGLTNKKFPKYMVTVLNRPEDFQYGETLVEMETKLASTDAGILDNSRNFVMSTTSWTGNSEERPSYRTGKQLYFVTEVDETNFSEEPITTDINDMSNAVPVYVERLAAKVTLALDELTNETKTLKVKDEDGEEKTSVGYKIEATVAGKDNAGVDPGLAIAAEDLYVTLEGWKLNATAKSSYIVKNIDESWTKDLLGFEWNKPSDFRSFWGKSFNYGKDTYSYPTTAEDYESSKDNYPLDYFSLNSDCRNLGENAYCAENTNTQEIVSSNFPSCVTSILVKATVRDENGKGLDLVRFNGLLFTQDQFLRYILNKVSGDNHWDVYVNDGGSTPVQAGTEYVELTNIADGKVKVELKNASSLVDNKGKTVNEKAVNAYLEAASDGAIGYNGGLMYYNIPIEHLNNTGRNDDGKYETISEANYGVVRNHYYKITINKLEKIGKGIFDPDEVIVPSDDDNDTYYVGAKFNILSWKIVSQTVDF